MKRELKVGERVRVFGMDMGPKGFADGAIKLPENEFGAVLVEVADGVVSAHPRQCVRLRRRERSEKSERVECWGRKSIHAYGAKFSHSQVYASKGAAEKATFHGERGVGFTLVGPPIRLVEVRPGEVVCYESELKSLREFYAGKK